MAFFRHDPARLEPQCGAQDGHAGVRPLRGARSLRAVRRKPVGGHRPGIAGHGRSSGLVGQRFHSGFRHVPPRRGGQRRRHRRDDGRRWGRAVPIGNREDRGRHPQLSAAVRHLQRGLCACHGNRATDVAQAGGGEAEGFSGWR
jgi:hypothetical protein